MRARYYEPQSRRFLSEDPGLDGRDWFGYCHNDPVNAGDESGKDPGDIESCLKHIQEALLEACQYSMGTMGGLSLAARIDQLKALILAIRHWSGEAQMAGALIVDTGEAEVGGSGLIGGMGADGGSAQVSIGAGLGGVDRAVGSVEIQEIRFMIEYLEASLK